MTTCPPLVLTRPMTEREYLRWTQNPATQPTPPKHNGWIPALGILVFCAAVITLSICTNAR